MLKSFILIKWHSALGPLYPWGLPLCIHLVHPRLVDFLDAEPADAEGRLYLHCCLTFFFEPTHFSYQ